MASTASASASQRLLAEVGVVEDLVAALVDDLALLVHHLVVLEDVLADLGVALLDGVLRPLDGLGDHLRLDRHVVGQGLAHHPVHGAGGEQAHELVLERQVEAALAGIALTARATAQLVVDAAALVALGAEHVEAAELADLVALGLGLDLVAGDQLGACAPGPRRCSGSRPSARTSRRARPSGLPPRRMSTPRPAMLVATVIRVQPAGLGDDLGLSGVLLGVQHLVGDAPLLEHAGESFSDFSTEIVPTSTGWPRS